MPHLFLPLFFASLGAQCLFAVWVWHKMKIDGDTNSKLTKRNKHMQRINTRLTTKNNELMEENDLLKQELKKKDAVFQAPAPKKTDPEAAPADNSTPADSHQDDPDATSESSAALPVANEPQEPSWQELSSTPLEQIDAALVQPWPRSLNIIRPGVQGSPLPETPEALEQLVESDPVVSNMLGDCLDAEMRLSIAESFIKKYAEEPDGLSGVLRSEDYQHVWVVGDVHTSLRALARICALIRKEMSTMGGSHALVFLGDAIDRGAQDLETVVFIQQLLMRHLESDSLQVHYIRGNHDMGLCRKEDGSYASTVSPSESVNRLNRLREKHPEAAEVMANSIMLLARISPCMFEVCGMNSTAPEKTILLAHGGVPHVDLQESLYKRRKEMRNKESFVDSVPEDIRPAVMKDFTWIRLVEKLPFKRPNRGTSGTEMGTQDVNTYRILHHQLTGRIITFIIRGHDHEASGYKLYSYDEVLNPVSQNRPQKNCGVLTINAMEPDESSCGLFRNRDVALVHLFNDMDLMDLYILPTKHL